MRPFHFLPVVLFAVVALPAICLAQSEGPDFRVQLDPGTCTFTGGSDGAGNVEVGSRNGGKLIQVSLINRDGYSIGPVVFEGPGMDQMVATAGGNAAVVNILNRNTGPADVKYSVYVVDVQLEQKDCDPVIINR